MYNVALLKYTVPGIPSIYYGSEFGIEGKKERGSDWNLRPYLDLKDYENYDTENELTKLFVKLGKLKAEFAELTDGEYEELLLTNRQYAYARKFANTAVITAMNNDDAMSHLEIRLPIHASKAVDLLQAEEKSEEERKIAEEAIKKEAKEIEDIKKKEQIQKVQENLLETQTACLTFSKRLEEWKEVLNKANTVIETEKEFEKVKEAKKALEEALQVLSTSYGRKEEEKQMAVGDRSIYNTQVQIRDGKLIVDLPANRGTIVYIS